MINQLVKASSEQLNVKLYNSNKQAIPLSELIKGKLTLLLFVRHFNCYVCRDQVKALNNEIKQEELANKNTQILVIACSKPEAIQEFSEDTGYPKEMMYVSQNLEAYQAFGMQRAASLSEIKGDNGMNTNTTSGTFSGMAWSLWKTVTRGTQGDVYQLGGEVLLKEDEIIFQKCNKSSQDYLNSKEVRQLLKI